MVDGEGAAVQRKSSSCHLDTCKSLEMGYFWSDFISKGNNILKIAWLDMLIQGECRVFLTQSLIAMPLINCFEMMENVDFF